MTDKAMPALPEQSGWGVNMHGYIVAFCSNAEKAIGHSPGAETPMFTKEQMLAYGRKCIEECAEQAERHYDIIALAKVFRQRAEQ